MKLKHPNDMSEQELRQLVFSMGWAALDLAQHLRFCVNLKPKYRKQADENAIAMAYKLTQMPYYSSDSFVDRVLDISIFGENGLSKIEGYREKR